VLSTRCIDSAFGVEVVAFQCGWWSVGITLADLVEVEHSGEGGDHLCRGARASESHGGAFLVDAGRRALAAR
jgi:hypothetical protein